MLSMSITWDLVARGLARIEVSDEHATTVLAAATTSYAPEDLLDAAYDMLCCGEDECRFVFETSTTAYAWLFARTRGEVAIRILRLPSWDASDEVGVEVWASSQTADALADATITCFQKLAARYDEPEYFERWHEPFPGEHLKRLESVFANRQKAKKSGGWWCF
ncbi:hypothetical protein ACFYUD_36195 [Nocardia tengchongensis]|uniref:hypothetical protein n=1 Tax=Nocardia tengchongensis TaxID=2055889 RepID=UPI0036960B9B